MVPKASGSLAAAAAAQRLGVPTLRGATTLKTRQIFVLEYSI